MPRLVSKGQRGESCRDPPPVVERGHDPRVEGGRRITGGLLADPTIHPHPRLGGDVGQSDHPAIKIPICEPIRETEIGVVRLRVLIQESRDPDEVIREEIAHGGGGALDFEVSDAKVDAVCISSRVAVKVGVLEDVASLQWWVT